MKSFNLGEALKMLTKTEYNLFLSSEAKKILTLTEKSLHSKIARLDKYLSKLKTQKMAAKRSRKSQGMNAAEATLKKKKKVSYLSEAQKRFKKQLKTFKKPAVAAKPVKKQNTNVRLIKEAKTSKGSFNHAAQEQNIKSNAKQSKFLKSAFERKSGHASARNRRFQGKKDGR